MTEVKEMSGITLRETNGGNVLEVLMTGKLSTRSTIPASPDSTLAVHPRKLVSGSRSTLEYKRLPAAFTI